MGFLDSKEKKTGFYATIIFHLVVLIIFLLTAIHGVVSEETSFVLDFSKLEELEKIAKQEGQKYGQWIPASHDPYDKVKFYRCSKCNRLISISPCYEVGKSLDEFPYCHCGAKMNGGAE